MNYGRWFFFLPICMRCVKVSCMHTGRSNSTCACLLNLQRFLWIMQHSRWQFGGGGETWAESVKERPRTKRIRDDHQIISVCLSFQEKRLKMAVLVQIVCHLMSLYSPTAFQRTQFTFSLRQSSQFTSFIFHLHLQNVTLWVVYWDYYCRRHILWVPALCLYHTLVTLLARLERADHRSRSARQPGGHSNF